MAEHCLIQLMGPRRRAQHPAISRACNLIQNDVLMYPGFQEKLMAALIPLLCRPEAPCVVPRAKRKHKGRNFPTLTHIQRGCSCKAPGNHAAPTGMDAVGMQRGEVSAQGSGSLCSIGRQSCAHAGSQQFHPT